MTPKLLRQVMSARAQHDRLMAVKGKFAHIEFVVVGFEWQTKQTREAAFFPSYGWVPHAMLRWRKPDGTVLPWDCGRQGDTLLMAAEFAKRAALPDDEPTGPVV